MVHKRKLKDTYWETVKKEANYHIGMVADININDLKFKRKVIREIKKSEHLTPALKKQILMTARKIKSNSFIWKKKWDKGKLFM